METLGNLTLVLRLHKARKVSEIPDYRNGVRYISLKNDGLVNISFPKQHDAISLLWSGQSALAAVHLKQYFEVEYLRHRVVHFSVLCKI